MHGRRVSLRPVSQLDLPLLCRWQNDPEIAHWMDYRGSFELSDVEQDQRRAAREGHPFVIEVDGHPIGKAGLNRVDYHARSCSLYIYIGEKGLWGQGLGRDAVMALCRAAFCTLGMQRVELSMLADNSRARRAYEACGFRPDTRAAGQIARAGGHHETTLMSVERPTFDRVAAAYMDV